MPSTISSSWLLLAVAHLEINLNRRCGTLSLVSAGQIEGSEILPALRPNIEQLTALLEGNNK